MRSPLLRNVQQRSNSKVLLNLQESQVGCVMKERRNETPEEEGLRYRLRCARVTENGVAPLIVAGGPSRLLQSVQT